MLYSHRRYVFSKAAITAWNAYGNLAQATAQKLTEYYMVSVWTAQQIVRLQKLKDVGELKKCIVVVPVRNKKPPHGHFSTKNDQKFQITRLS